MGLAGLVVAAGVGLGTLGSYPEHQVPTYAQLCYAGPSTSHFLQSTFPVKAALELSFQANALPDTSSFTEQMLDIYLV